MRSADRPARRRGASRYNFVLRAQAIGLRAHAPGVPAGAVPQPSLAVRPDAIRPLRTR
jgi:hypothetical protein